MNLNLDTLSSLVGRLMLENIALQEELSRCSKLLASYQAAEASMQAKPSKSRDHLSVVGTPPLLEEPESSGP